MKVYVDELPKDCIGCPCESEYYCNLLNEYVDCCKWGEIHKNCPLQSLTDYTKQVRKEEYEEVKEKVLKHFNVKSEEEYEKSLSLLDSLFTADVVFEILDQI